MWVLQGEEVVRKDITYTPGLYKIYDEILVNAADNKQRNPDSMDKLEIDIDPEKNLISVKNNGKGIPIEWHKDAECHVPTLVFGQLLTGSNFDDDEKKTTGGRNGYGAKLANIFSTEFIVECGTGNKTFSQTFRDNMREKDDPIIKTMTAAEVKRGDYVKISFRPDLERFKMDRLDEDTVQLLSKRAYDMAGSLAFIPGKKLSVSLNGNKLKIPKFENYLKMYNGIEAPTAFEVVDNRWEVGVGVSDGNFDQISFVNSISTTKGGEHVNYIADQVAKKLSEIIAKKNKGGGAIKPAQIKNYMTVFVNCLVDNPSFDSQTKEFLTTKKSKFGSKCELSAAFLKKIEKSEIVTRIISFAKFKEKEKLGKKGGRKVVKLTGIVKLDDANFAGSAKSKDCTLILTEGDSAKSLAMSGISVVGRDYYGVFPLKGKPLNVREASVTQVMKNEEIKNVIDIMGLKFGTVYDETNVKTLRYGHLMIMADQDHDGSHIKGLIINFIHHFWPSLLNIPGFLQQFITPIVKATKGKGFRTFFTLPEYLAWKDSTGNDAKGWKIKYYKGLGTSTSAEVSRKRKLVSFVIFLHASANFLFLTLDGQ
jgi:DNA topoisomerase-2